MSALSVFYLVLPFPLAFILHDAEEVVVQHRWMLRHQDGLAEKFPKLIPVIHHLLRLGTKEFALAALEELLILLLATCYVLLQGKYSTELWSALFLAFSLHLLIHFFQSLLVRGYVPGLITSLMLLPYCYLGLQSIWSVMSGVEMVLLGIAGVTFMVANLLFAHWMSVRIFTVTLRSKHKYDEK